MKGMTLSTRSHSSGSLAPSHKCRDFQTLHPAPAFFSSSFLLYFFSSRNSFLFLNNPRYTPVDQRTFIHKHESSPARVGGNALGPGRQNIPSAASFSPHKFHWKGIESNVNTMPDKAREAGCVDHVTPHCPGMYSVSTFQRSSANDSCLLGASGAEWEQRESGSP